MGLVHVSPVGIHQVSTGPIEDQLGPVATSPNISLNWFFSTKVVCSVIYLVYSKYSKGEGMGDV